MSEPETALRRALSRRIERGEFPGVVTALAHGDDVRVEALGVTAAGGTEPMRRDTPFRIASMTKPVVAAATLALAEEGRLALDEPVHRLLPELAGQRVLARPDGPLEDTVPAVRPVTVADLLTFTMGFGLVVEPEFDPPWPVTGRAQELGLAFGPPEPRSPHDPDSWIRRFATLPLIHQPGTRWNYDAGTMVLGVLLARAAGRPLGDVLRERVFDPLGMTGTGFVLTPERAAALPPQYSGSDGGVPSENAATRAEVWTRPPAFPSGSGGLVSTADDFLAFARMLLHGGRHGRTRVLSADSVAAITTNRLTPELIASGGPILGGSGWGLGVAVTVAADEVSGPGRYGWSGGYGTTWFTDPAAGLTAVALTQVSDVMTSGVLDEFGRLAYAAAGL